MGIAAQTAGRYPFRAPWGFGIRMVYIEIRGLRRNRELERDERKLGRPAYFAWGCFRDFVFQAKRSTADSLFSPPRAPPRSDRSRGSTHRPASACRRKSPTSTSSRRSRGG